MTTLYRPALIESAEQAEALPEGTIATHDEHWPAVRCTPNRWESSARDMKHADMVGWTALVPIEAEEETREHPTRVEERPESAYLQPVQQVRYKTRWETA